jgi:hypothetical protein
MTWTFLVTPILRLWDWILSRSRKREDDEWEHKFTDAISALSNALPRTLIDGPSGFAVLVPDKEMRTRIETHLIEPERSSYSGTTVRARTLSPEHLRSSIVRRTIQDVLDCADNLRSENPGIARRLRL